MGPLLALLGVVMVVVGAVALVWLLASGLRSLWAARNRPGRRRQVLVGCISLVGAAVLAAVPFAAAGVVEARNDWIDANGDGMLDGFTSGSYDWMDVNGGDWFRAAGLMVAVVLAVTLVLSRAVGSPGSRHADL
jgi:hypothetical protein